MTDEAVDRLLRGMCLVGASVVLSKSDCTSDAGGLAQLEAIRDHLYEGLTTGHIKLPDPKLITKKP
jgi:hypothetical protein